MSFSIYIFSTFYLPTCGPKCFKPIPTLPGHIDHLTLINFNNISASLTVLKCNIVTVLCVCRRPLTTFRTDDLKS